MSCLLALLLIDASERTRGDDRDYWNQQIVEGPAIGRWKPWFYADTRTGLETGRWTGYVLSPRMRYALTDHLNAEAHYSWVSTRGPGSGLVGQHRAELELNPHRRFGERWTAILRNRLESRWIEGHDGVDLRARHRLHVEYALQGMGPWTSVFLQEEVFVELGSGRVTENRLVPLGFGFRLGKHAGLRLYYAWRPIRTTERWHDTHFLASQMVWRF
jgi:hypothetical protein